MIGVTAAAMLFLPGLVHAEEISSSLDRVKPDTNNLEVDESVPLYRSFKFLEDETINPPTKGWKRLFFKLDKSLKKRLEKSGIIPLERDDFRLYGTYQLKDYYSSYNGGKSQHEINKNKGIKAMLGAGIDVLDDTPLSQRVRRIVKEIEPYFRTELSKYQGEKTKFYLPGKAVKSLNTKKGKKEWGTSMELLPYSEAEIFVLGITTRINLEYKNTKLTTSYDTGSQKIKMSFGSGNIDRFLTKKLKSKHRLFFRISTVYDLDKEELSGMSSIGFYF